MVETGLDTNTTNVLDKKVTIDDESQLFETPSKNNHGATSTRSQVLLGSDSMRFKNNNTSYMTG